jgi:hypothetical protein
MLKEVSSKIDLGPFKSVYKKASSFVGGDKPKPSNSVVDMAKGALGFGK